MECSTVNNRSAFTAIPTADIYSFAITMLECYTWKEAFPKELFKFPWDIADCVVEGNRPQTINEIENLQMKDLIELSWKQDPTERLPIDNIIERLEKIFK